ncbi:hypothetical protein SAY86_006136 [Trapa natans]|uniref:Uncharacterized protein n=1 Tax=Trapa natans TaxID=22666 RepID=A0AAN7QXD6_TRANT|nr:hypothetical protein SAY86_006136 [Trapa natans]
MENDPYQSHVQQLTYTNQGYIKNMQILRWLFKAAREQEGVKECIATNLERKLKDIVLLEQRRKLKRSRSVQSGTRKFKSFINLCRRDIANACFYSTISLRRVGSINMRRRWKVYSWRRTKGEDITGQMKAAAEPLGGSHVGSKFLPITGSNIKVPSFSFSCSSSSSSSSCEEPAKKEKEEVKGDEARAISRMKVLLRWAAAAKSDKGSKFIRRKVLHFGSRSAALKAVQDDEQLSIDSPKISFRWDVEGCSTMSSAYSTMSTASAQTIGQMGGSLLESPPRKGNWVTTDSEYVVLELRGA